MNSLLRIFFVGSLKGIYKFAWYLIITSLVLLIKIVAGGIHDKLLYTMAIGFGVSLLSLLAHILSIRKEKSALKEMERLFNERNLEL